MSRFETTDGSSAVTTTRQTDKLTHGHGLSVTEKVKLVHYFCISLLICLVPKNTLPMGMFALQVLGMIVLQSF